MINKKYVFPVIVFITVLLVWQGITLLLRLPSFILPSPLSVASEIYYHLGDILFPHFFITFFEAIAGFAIAIIISFLLILIFDFSPSAKLSIYPYIVAIKIAPIIAIAPFLILWFGNGLASKIVAASITAIFSITISLTKGFEEVEAEYIDLMKSFSASKWQTFTKLKFPNSIPYLFSGLKMAAVFSISGAVVAEFIGSSKGLGFFIITNYYYLKTSLMFATLFILFLGGIAFFGLISYIEKKFFSKYNIGGKDEK
ncbi:MAG: ABC transporter permease [Nanoarchaeota archaeon]|nr:ABC transporter permease [Nanoarchaeota archaeon]